VTDADLARLDALLVVLRRHNVHQYERGDLKIVLVDPPQPAPDKPTPTAPARSRR
jgi:hypothetical protein